VLSSTLVLAAVLVSAVLAEILIAVLAPQPTMFPRYEFSPDYGFTNYANSAMIHRVPGRWRFVYTTNQYGNRGRAVPISNDYGVPNIVVLGDSYSFGMGVNDGEEYPAVMSEAIDGSYNVTNLGVGGWGLAQQIRRYYEFGQLYAPKIVVLQFHVNDLDDNFNNQVTIVENGTFRFVQSKSNLNWIKKYLSHSVIQKSQFYNLLRGSAYRFLAARHVQSEMTAAGRSTSTEVPIREQFYSELLEVFSRDLHRRGVALIMIAVAGHLDRAPSVQNKVFELELLGLLTYEDVANLFIGISDYGSAEGHLWGKKAHNILGKRLSEVVSHIHTEPKVSITER